ENCAAPPRSAGIREDGDATPRAEGRGRLALAREAARLREGGAVEAQETAVQTDRVLTVPNVLSVLRLLGVPLFLWLILVEEADGWALLVLAVSGVTDYLDGVLARRWKQISRVGQLLDPLADRAYILATLVGLTLRDIIPLWLAAALVARDVVMTGV